MLALGVGLFDPNNPLVTLNSRLHSSGLYNGFQIGVNALAIFTGAASASMKCFIAGTMILTASGLVAIEAIKAGDEVISTNADTFEVAEKPVLETYIRETTELVHLTINGELIKTTYEHPFYVKEHGFVNAGELYIGDKLLDSNGSTLIVEDRKVEIIDKPVKVYNFQVEDFHTYHVGENCILVHNADYDVDLISKNMRERISDEELNAPLKRGDTPTSKKDGHPIEIHHNEQNPNGPFYEKTRTDHRLGKNYKGNHPNYNQKSKVNRSQFKYQQKKYWQNEWDRGRWK